MDFKKGLLVFYFIGVCILLFIFIIWRVVV